MSLKTLTIIFGFTVAVAAIPNCLRAEPPSTKTFFDERIAPLFARHCLSCHNATAKKGGLDLSTNEAAVRGGESGPAWIPNQPTQSLLWQRIIENEMPPDNALSAEEKNDLKDWIAHGAHWGADRIDPLLSTTDKRAGYDWWSLQPIGKAPLPRRRSRNSSGGDHPIDRYVRAQLQQHDLKPSPPAQPSDQLRLRRQRQPSPDGKPAGQHLVDGLRRDEPRCRPDRSAHPPGDDDLRRRRP